MEGKDEELGVSNWMIPGECIFESELIDMNDEDDYDLYDILKLFKGERLGLFGRKIRKRAVSCFSPLVWFPAVYGKKGKVLPHIFGDFIAGLTVGVMLIPQGMGYAMIAGLPPIYGLYAALIPQIIYSFLGTSRVMTVAAVALLCLMVRKGILTNSDGVDESNMPEYLGLTVLLSFMVGITQIILGSLRLGFLVNFIGKPVLSGFISAACLIIILSQTKHLLGLSVPSSSSFLESIYFLFLEITNTNWPTVLLSACCVTALVGYQQFRRVKRFDKWSKFIPSEMIVVALGIGVTYLFSLEDYGLNLVGSVPSGLPPFSLPPLSKFVPFTGTAISIALISFTQSFAVAQKLASDDEDYEVNPSQELIALGCSNLLGSFFSSLPVAGGLSRSVVNFKAGAKSPISFWVTSSIVLFSMLFLPPVLYYLPKAALAAVIVVAISSLFDYPELIYLWKVKKMELLM